MPHSVAGRRLHGAAVRAFTRSARGRGARRLSNTPRPRRLGPLEPRGVTMPAKRSTVGRMGGLPNGPGRRRRAGDRGMGIAPRARCGTALQIIKAVIDAGATIKVLDRSYIDLTTPMGRGFMAMMSAMAEERTLAHRRAHP
jgi:hypothetical protein